MGSDGEESLPALRWRCPCRALRNSHQYAALRAGWDCRSTNPSPRLTRPAWAKANWTPPQQGLSPEDDERRKTKGHCMATPGACSVSTGCGEAWAIRNQRIPLRFKIKSTEGDFVAQFPVA